MPMYIPSSDPHAVLHQQLELLILHMLKCTQFDTNLCCTCKQYIAVVSILNRSGEPCMTVSEGLTTANTIIQLAPAILGLIAQLEMLFKAKKSGPARKAVVMATVAHMPDDVKTGISVLVDSTVAAKNALPTTDEAAK